MHIEYPIGSRAEPATWSVICWRSAAGRVATSAKAKIAIDTIPSVHITAAYSILRRRSEKKRAFATKGVAVVGEEAVQPGATQCAKADIDRREARFDCAVAMLQFFFLDGNEGECEGVEGFAFTRCCGQQGSWSKTISAHCSSFFVLPILL